MKLGICLDAVTLKECRGLDYIEENVQNFLCPLEDEQTFERKLIAAQSAGIPIVAACCFLPGKFKCVGPAVDETALLNYTTTAFARAEKAGIACIVFGSGGARNIPAGFPIEQAREQIIALLKKLGPLAEKHGITLVVEPLNKGECNFINTLAQGADLVAAAAHPAVKLLADFYHMLRDGESAEEIIKYGALIRHCHLAEKAERTAPGVKGDDFTPYLRALKQVGYHGRLSIESKWQNPAQDAPKALEALRKQLHSAGY